MPLALIRHSLWISDGTTTGTMMVKDINPAGSGWPSGFTLYNNVFFFQANDGIHGNELWQSDGTETGTVLVRDINETGDSNPYNFTPMGNTLFFGADDGVSGYELWFWGSDNKFYVIPNADGGVIISL